MEPIEFKYMKQGSPTSLLYTTYGTKDLTGKYYHAEDVDRLRAALDALVVQVNKAIESYMLDDSGKFAENISALRMQAIAAAEGRER